MKTLSILILATALAVTAGCANEHESPVTAAPASGTAGFGAGPTTPPPSASPTPDAPEREPPVKATSPEAKTSTAPRTAEIPEWAEVVKKSGATVD